MQRSRGLLPQGVGIILASACVGCDSPAGPRLDSAQVPDIRPFATSELAGRLNGSGQFEHEWACDAGFEVAVSIAQAEALAELFARRFLGSEVPIGDLPPAGQELSEAHGHAIQWDRAHVGVRATLCAESPLEPMPLEFDQSTLNHYGPYYLVPLYVDHDQVALVDVAALATIYVTDSGSFEGKAGGEFKWAASPHGHPFGNPLSPEAAVQIASEATGALVSGLPRLLGPGHRVVIHQARWEVRLNRPVEGFRSSDGTPIQTEVVYVGLYPSFTDFVAGEPWAPRLFVAAPVQPTEQLIGVRYPDESREEVAWPIKEDVPTTFWEVTF